MARLFITPREIDFISDLTKEITKDVAGQKIFYYSIREDLTDVHDVYEEAPEKVFDPPVEIEGLVEWSPYEVRTNRFGGEEFGTMVVYLHSRDLLDRDIVVREGDYFSYGAVFFEITSFIEDKQVYGQIEHKIGFKITGKQARKGQINIRPEGPLDEKYTDEDAVQQEFVQQRGQTENELGETGDKRALQEQGKLDKPAPRKVSKDGISSSFYGEDC